LAPQALLLQERSKFSTPEHISSVPNTTVAARAETQFEHISVIRSVTKNPEEREVLQVARALGSIPDEDGSLRGPAVLTGLDACSHTTAESFHVRSERDSQPHAELHTVTPV
jgi:hypothetical protein